MFLTIFSPMNTITFYPRVNEGIFIGQDSRRERIKYDTHNRKDKYQQTAQFGDYITIQIHANTTFVDDIKLYLKSCTDPFGDNAMEIPYTYRTDWEAIYNTYDENGNTVYLWTAQFNFRFSQLLTLEQAGTWYLEARTTFPGGNQGRFDSEPIDVQLLHKNTQLIEYTCDTNKHDTLFEQWNTGFAKRLPVKVDIFNPQREEEIFTTQYQQEQKVSSYAYDITALFFDNLPDYELQKLRNILLCDKFKIGRNIFTSAEQIEAERSGNSNLYKATVEVRDYDLQQSYAYQTPTTFVSLFLTGIQYPFYMFDHSINDGFRYIFLGERRIFDSSDEVDDYVQELNDVLVPQQGLKGFFDRDVDGSITYTNGEGENYSQYGNKVSAKKITFFVTATAGQIFSISLREFIYGIDWGDGSFFTQGNDSNNTAYQTYMHVFDDAGSYQVAFYHAINTGDGPVEGTGIIYNPSASLIPTPQRATLTNIVGGSNGTTGNLKQIIILQASFTLPALSLPFLQNSYATLESITINDSAMNALTPATLNTTGNPAIASRWVKLKMLDLGRNKLSSANVDALLQTVVNNFTLSLRAYVNVKGQAPPAPPGTAGNTAKTTIVNAGGTVYND
jgi:hypothetical protein